MEAKWYYAENGESLGPMRAEDVLRRMGRRKNQLHMVWTEGLAEWTDATKLPDFASAFREAAPLPEYEAAKMLDAASAEKKATLAQRAKHELIEFGVVSLYLYVCFGALIFYKASILHSEGIAFGAYGLAIAKALILGKFLVTLQAFKIGEAKSRLHPALVNILKKSLLFTLLLVVLTVIEEFIVGYFHGKTGREVLSEIAGGTLQQALAVAVLLFLILVPFFAFQEIAARLGKGRLSKLLTQRPPADEAD